MAYSEVYFFPQNSQTSSKLFYIHQQFSAHSEKKVSGSIRASFLYELDNPENSPSVILESGTNSMESQSFRTLTIVDWSYDSNRLLIKEKEGEHCKGIKATNLWIYDFTTGRSKRLDAIRKSIVYYWKKKNNIYLNNYSWDIVPLGWDIADPDRIVVNAYGYNVKDKQFLGCWSIDINGQRSLLLSLTNKSWPVAKFGLVLNKNSQK